MGRALVSGKLPPDTALQVGTPVTDSPGGRMIGRVVHYDHDTGTVVMEVTDEETERLIFGFDLMPLAPDGRAPDF